MDSDFETMRIILSGSAGMSAREILKKIKTMNQLGLPTGSDSTQWVKRDVNSVLYKMLKDGLVENKIRNSPRPYWKLISDESVEEIYLDQSSILPDAKEVGEQVDKWWADLEHKIKSAFEDYGAIYRDELEQIIGFDFQVVASSFPYYKKLIIEPADSLENFTKWTKEDAISSIKKASTYYFPLSGPNYQNLIDIGEIEGPGIQRIYKQFGWPEICNEAGVEFKPAPRGDYLRTWSDDELLSFVIRFLQSPIESDSYHMYSRWRSEQIEHVPTMQSITNYLGNWSFVRNNALESIRISKGKELRK
jgi:hypothetical protein